MDFQSELIELSDELDSLADRFITACQQYSEFKCMHQEHIGLALMDGENKKMSVEKLVALLTQDERFKLINQSFEQSKALKLGIEAKINSKNSQIITRQSLMKHYGKIDQYGNII